MSSVGKSIFRASLKKADIIFDTAKNVSRMSDEAFGNLKNAMKKNFPDLPTGMIDEISEIRKGVGGEDFVVFKNKKTMNISDFNKKLKGSVGDLVPPNKSGLYKEIMGAAADPSIIKKLKKVDLDNLNSMKKTKGWSDAVDMKTVKETGESLGKNAPLPKGSQIDDIQDGIKKSGKGPEFDDFVKKAKKTKTQKVGTFLKYSVGAAAITSVGVLIDKIIKHQDDLNGCWVRRTNDDGGGGDVEKYKIVRGECDKCEEPNCTAAKALDTNTINRVDSEWGDVLEAEGGVDDLGGYGNFLWSPCGVESNNELCCDGKCGTMGDGDTCDYASGRDQTVTAGVTCKVYDKVAGTTRTCKPQWDLMFESKSGEVCPTNFESLIGVKYNDEGLVEGAKDCPDCNSQWCNNLNISIIQLGEDTNEWVVECVQVDFWGAASDYMGVDGLTGYVTSIFDDILKYGKYVLYAVLILWALGMVWFIVSNFVLPMFRGDTSTSSSWWGGGRDDVNVNIKIDQGVTDGATTAATTAATDVIAGATDVVE
tara:strand:+ start:466 stop:2073 length:1608 start_codon:yes stop_codon:yes gene_type:complete